MSLRDDCCTKHRRLPAKRSTLCEAAVTMTARRCVLPWPTVNDARSSVLRSPFDRAGEVANWFASGVVAFVAETGATAGAGGAGLASA